MNDMPYDQFVKAQIAGDLLDHKEKYSPGLGFYGLRPKGENQEDRVDATSRGFLGLTVACAQCHNHKFDPIPTTDYYSLLGIFTSTEESEYNLAPEAAVKAYKDQEKKVQEQEARISRFPLYAGDPACGDSRRRVSALLAGGAEGARSGEDGCTVKPPKRITWTAETLGRWVRYLQAGPKDYRYLDNWQDDKFDLEKFRQHVLAVLKERKSVDETNTVAKAEAKKAGPKVLPKLISLKTESYYLWRDLFFNDFYGNQFKQEDDGVLYYGPNRGYVTSDGEVERFLQGFLEGAPGFHARRTGGAEAGSAAALSVRARHQRTRPNRRSSECTSEEPRRIWAKRFRIISSRFCATAPPQAFEKGSGRLELAEAIANPRNPLTARVMVNRIWQHHFGAGIVRTPSDFGRMGDRPSDPELLDYLASRFVESGWSMKALHREIMLSADLCARARTSRRRTWASIRKTGCSGARTSSGWMRKRCAIRCSRFPASSISQRAGLRGS